ncbi:MAG: hypothetical protein RJB01_864 [Actinomycetota bacterium]
MIAFVRGRVVAVNVDRVVVDLGSVGITVHTTPGVVNGTSVGSELFLHTSMVVREDGWTLYGFAESAECAVFEKVQTVSGIGPRLAAAILAVMGADGLVEAVATENLTALTAVPGIGRKGAQRLVLELKGSLDAPVTASLPTGGWQTAVESGLVSLGWNPREAVAAISELDVASLTDPKDPDISILLKAALRSLDRA